MAKKKADGLDISDGLDGSVMAEDGAVTEQAPRLIVEDDAGQVIWTMGVWGTFPQWRCALCSWDTLDGEQAMVAHYLATHAPPPPPAAPQTIIVYDRYGNPVK